MMIEENGRAATEGRKDITPLINLICHSLRNIKETGFPI